MRKKLSTLGTLVAASTLVLTTATFAAPKQAGARPAPPQGAIARQANPPGPKGGPGMGPQYRKGNPPGPKGGPGMGPQHRHGNPPAYGRTNPPGKAYGRKNPPGPMGGPGAGPKYRNGNQPKPMDRPSMMGQKDQQMPQGMKPMAPRQ